MKAGAWLHRQFTAWNQLDPGQHDLLTRIGLTPDHISLSARKKTPTPTSPRHRRSFEQNATLLRAFVERHGRPPGAREWIEADGERVMIGPWLCKARIRHKSRQLPQEQGELLQEILREDWSGTDRTSEEGHGDLSEVL
ncbi:helicase associated domain-containing protein [Streptomyces sp. NPDC023838]|uniref:helicase associated domain-containing protein n=1 Tax=Streptomyces sp. NPDC023838 TaxID=3154325 RepID=UPI0033CAD992